MVRTVLLLAALCFVAGLPAQDLRGRSQTVRAVSVAGPFSFPWCVAWLPDGSVLITERDGRLNVIRDGRSARVSGVPRVSAVGQGGLFDVLVLPTAGGRQEILLSYAWEEGGGRSLRVAKATLENTPAGWNLKDLTPIFDVLPRLSARIQFGGRLALLNDGSLLIATGDHGTADRAQDPSDGAGKVHRIRLDGTVPPDNPFVGKAGYQPSIWTSGHRNIQGLWVDPDTGTVWATEHGPMGGDEVNILIAGHNYGWPTITYGVNYGTGTKIGEGFAKPGMDQPVLYWKPSIAPSGFTRYNGDRYPAWRGSFFSGALAGQGLSRFVVAPLPATPKSKPDRATIPASAPAVLLEEEFLPSGSLGRIRDVRTGPDGYLYLTTDDPSGRLYRLEPLS